MEITKTRRDSSSSGSGSTSLIMPYGFLQEVVDDIIVDKVVSCTGTMTLSRQTALPTSIVSYSHTIPGQPTGSIVSTDSTFWPTRIPASQCGATVYLWYGDADTIYYFTDADTVSGMTTVRLNTPEITYTGNNMFIYNGNGAWRMYITGSGTLTVSDDLTFDAWGIGGGGAGAGNAAGDGTDASKENGRGGGGGGYRSTMAAQTITSGIEYFAIIGAGGSATNTNATGEQGGQTELYDTTHNILSCPGGYGGRKPSALVGGKGGDGGSGGGGGGAFHCTPGAGGKNGADGSKSSSTSTNDNGQTRSGGAGGTGSGVSGYAFGDSSFDGIRRGDGGDGGTGKGTAADLVTGNANSGTGGSGASGYDASNTTAYKGRNGGSGLIILRGTYTA